MFNEPDILAISRTIPPPLHFLLVNVSGNKTDHIIYVHTSGIQASGCVCVLGANEISSIIIIVPDVR